MQQKRKRGHNEFEKGSVKSQKGVKKGSSLPLTLIKGKGVKSAFDPY
jgi:hypothetical protein